jgi:hypothetical protein
LSSIIPNKIAGYSVEWDHLIVKLIIAASKLLAPQGEKDCGGTTTALPKNLLIVKKEGFGFGPFDNNWLQ